MKLFFNNLNDLTYTINNKDYTIKDIFDINLQFDKIKKYQDSTNYYFSHSVSDGEKWETISYKYYKSVNAFWILVLLNGDEDLFYDFVLSIPEISLATNYILSNNQITQDLFDTTVIANDEKRVIKILKPQYIKDFENDVFDYKLIK